MVPVETVRGSRMSRLSVPTLRLISLKVRLSASGLFESFAGVLFRWMRLGSVRGIGLHLATR